MAGLLDNYLTQPPSVESPFGLPGPYQRNATPGFPGASPPPPEPNWAQKLTSTVEKAAGGMEGLGSSVAGGWGSGQGLLPNAPQRQRPFGIFPEDGATDPSQRTGNPITDYVDPIMARLDPKDSSVPTSALDASEVAAVLSNPNIPEDTGAILVKKNSEQAAKEAEQDLENSGATEQELEGWRKFTDQFDLTTVGMALLASNDGSGNLSSNLGKAMMMGKKAKDSQIALAKEDDRFATKEAREERKVDISAADSATKERVADTAKYNAQVEAAYKKARIPADLEIARMRAAATRAGASGGITVPTKTEQDAINTFAEAKMKEGGFGAEFADPSTQVKYAMNVKQALELAPPGTNPQKVMDDVWNATISVRDNWSDVGPTYQ